MNQIYNKSVYGLINILKNKKTFNIINKITNTKDYDLITKNLYLGNINSANNLDFLQKENIYSIVNCTENEPFHNYFSNKPRIRINIKDNKDNDNIIKFTQDIHLAVLFIDEQIDLNHPTLVHCHWGLMRSATVVCGYLMYKYGLSVDESINYIKELRPMAMNRLYSFSNVLNTYEQNTLKKINNK